MATSACLVSGTELDEIAWVSLLVIRISVLTFSTLRPEKALLIWVSFLVASSMAEGLSSSGNENVFALAADMLAK
jgi:hypothetical protein